LAKKPVVKTIKSRKIWSNDSWIVRLGQLNSGPGRPETVRSLFSAIGEKLPFDSLGKISQHLKQAGITRNGIYVAHDSMGHARYIGRGRIFSRLRACRRRHRLELMYFSFYVVEQKKHEREIETLLIRAAGPMLQFNTQKKRITISAGNVRDYEAGTLFYERRYMRGKKPKRI
jgi:hypothetical protein